MKYDIMLQGFHWRSSSISGRSWYSVIQENAQRIKDSGFTLVWFPPPSDSLAYEGYLPRKLNVLDSKYGSQAELKAAIRNRLKVISILFVKLNLEIRA